MANKTHWKKMTNPDYLGTYSLEDGKDMVVTIKSVQNEMVTDNQGKKEECVVIYFSEQDKPLIANKTNLKTIAKLLGSDYIEDWTGKKIQIGSEKVSAFGEVVDALRVRKKLPSEVKITCEGCGKLIVGAYGMDVEQMANYTLTKYGKKLCAACAQKESEKTDGTESK